MPGLALQSNPVLGQSLSFDLGNSAGRDTFAVLLVGDALDPGMSLLVDPLWVFPVALPAGGTSASFFVPDDPEAVCAMQWGAQLVALDAAATRGSPHPAARSFSQVTPTTENGRAFGCSGKGPRSRALRTVTEASIIA